MTHDSFDLKILGELVKDARVSQVQLAQPFLSMLFAVPLLGERLDAVTMGFGLAVMATVFIGKKMPVDAMLPKPLAAKG